ncbi:MAG TPA: isovaleryl-CoA dehydrogenase [Methyloceanibacter sp.]|jgi:putative acyl-CoA dehydrogenase|nr:isovaleryl-CoA dehydrogenase [Methyloceanibacter sp.]
MTDRRLSDDQAFNQSPPFVDVNLFTSDTALQEAVRREGAAQAYENLSAFGGLVGSAASLELGRLANEHPPQLKSFDPRGDRIDLVEFHPAYHQLMAISTAQGLHCSTWEHLLAGTRPKPGAHVARCAGSYMAAQMEAGHCCPITMTHAAIASLRHAPSIARDLVAKILSRSYDPGIAPIGEKSAITLGMGMTERQGGTDVRANTTRAEPIDGRGPGRAYAITGHKWFLSAPMSDAFLVLAQAEGGLSCFLLPRLTTDGALNGLRLQRLKDKLGNRSNASAEVEFDRAEGLLVGEEGRGIPTIIDMVTLTRLDCAVSSAGLMRQALARAIHHARHRSVFQRRLIDQPLMAQVLADMALDVEAATALAFRLARAFDGEGESEAPYRRLMTPVTKYWVCKTAPSLAYEAMECLGGNGYVEDGGFPRLYREVPVNAIWEGSGNVMCLDVLRVIEREPETLDKVLAEVETIASVEPRLKKAVIKIKELARGVRHDQGAARTFVELLALAGAAALLASYAPNAVSDAFLATRLQGSGRNTYGAGVAHADTNDILARAASHLV